MGLLADIEELFDVKSLYEVLKVDKDANEADIKKAYRQLSLKYHPDRHVDAADDQKDLMTRRFQVLSQVHFVLSDAEKRQLYDTAGVIAGEDSIESERDWSEYWRLLFPKITTKDIDDYIAKYIGSDQERDDVREAYLKYQGDMDKISEAVIAFDEDRTRALIERLIKEENLEQFKKFTTEPKIKRERRRKRFEKEARAAEKEKKKQEEQGPSEALITAIQRRNQDRESSFHSLMANLEAKYGGTNGSKKGKKVSNGKSRTKELIESSSGDEDISDEEASDDDELPVSRKRSAKRKPKTPKQTIKKRIKRN